MQYRIWGELVVGGQHVSMDEAPDNTMFNELVVEIRASLKMSSHL